MPNKARGSELWSEILQVSVTPEVKNRINDMATEAGISQSNVLRNLLDRVLFDEEFSQGE